MGERDAGVGRGRDGRTDAGDDLERDPRLGQRLGLFAAATEDEGVAALEPHHAAATAGVVDQHRVDLRLRQEMRAGLLAREDTERRRGRFVQKARVDETVVDDDVRPPQPREAADGEKARIARARADERDRARAHHPLARRLTRRRFASSRLPRAMRRRRSPRSARRQVSPPGARARPRSSRLTSETRAASAA